MDIIAIEWKYIPHLKGDYTNVRQANNRKTLFKQYPDIFISTAKYLPPELRLKAVTLIQTVFPDYTVASRGEDRVKGIIDTVKKMVADKVDKDKIIEVIISNRKNDIKAILVEIL